MFPGFFVGTIFLFWLVRTAIGGPRWRYHHGYQRPWGPFAGESLWGDLGDVDRPRRSRDAAPPEPRRTSFGSEPLDEAVRQFVQALRDGLHATPDQKRAFDAAVTNLRGAVDDVQAR